MRAGAATTGVVGESPFGGVPAPLCCSACGNVLDKVWRRTPERIYIAAYEKATRQLPFGWKRPPARRIAPWRYVRGMLRCPCDLCRAQSFRHRDVDAGRLILRNEHSVDAGHGTLACMTRGVHIEDPAGIFYLWS